MRFGIVRPPSDDDNSNGDTSSNSDGDSSTTKKKTVVVEPLGVEHYGEIEAQLGYTFLDKNLLKSALTHRSMTFVTTPAQTQSSLTSPPLDYERLEFLGDAVLDLAVAHLLLEKHPSAKEGELSKMRAALVNTFSLATVAQVISLGKFVRLSRGELASGGAERPSILADVVEAVLGAVYREGGYEAARGCVEKLLGDQLISVKPRDPKTELQEALHAGGSQSPTYRLECVEGPEHAPQFISVVEVDGQIVGRGRGATKKASQQAAAEEALEKVRGGDAIDQKFLTEDSKIVSGIEANHESSN